MFGSVLHDITSIFAEYKTTTATKWRACIEDCPHPEVCPHPDSCPHRSYMLTLRSSSPLLTIEAAPPFWQKHHPAT